MFLLGADTEFLAIKTIKGKEILFPMEGLLTGSKAAPDYIDPERTRGVLLDNVCIEYVCKPADNKKDFVNEQLFMLQYVETILSTYRLKVSHETAGLFDEKYLQTENNRTFGCSPAFNARTGQAFEAPSPNTNLRTASFHLHISLDKKMSFDDAARLALICDLHIGVPSVIMQKDKMRRKLYGKAGEFRHTPYGGMEYRVLGNEYLFDKEKLELTYDQVSDAINWFIDGKSISSELADEMERVINGYDEDGARELIKKFNLKVI